LTAFDFEFFNWHPSKQNVLQFKWWLHITVLPQKNLHLAYFCLFEPSCVMILIFSTRSCITSCLVVVEPNVYDMFTVCVTLFFLYILMSAEFLKHCGLIFVKFGYFYVGRLLYGICFCCHFWKPSSLLFY